MTLMMMLYIPMKIARLNNYALEPKAEGGLYNYGYCGGKWKHAGQYAVAWQRTKYPFQRTHRAIGSLHTFAAASKAWAHEWAGHWRSTRKIRCVTVWKQDDKPAQ